MPRQPRLVLPGIAVHVIQRGNDRNPCFKGASDHMAYLAHLRELADKLECAIHAYCLMTNHVHLLLTPAHSGGCTALMRDLGQRYVQYFNRIHGRTGTLWEGRYRSSVTESARYVLACYRYIELNPVRAGMVIHPSGYPWSSYRVNSGKYGDPLITPHPDFLALGTEPARRQEAYLALFEQALEASTVNAIRDATNGGYPLGTDAFKERIATEIGRRTERSLGGRPRKAA
jgi:putative transposase